MTSTRLIRAAGALVVVGALLAACSSSPSNAASKGPLLFSSFNPFSGPDAAFGPEMVVACDAATSLINQAGGVLGHKTTCNSVDTHGDPADAVAAANKMLATESNLVGILGPSSDEALATVPIIAQGKIPMFADTGQAAFDKTTVPYFWRISPADDVKGFAMAIWAQHMGYTRAAAVFGNDAGSQSDVPTLLTAFSKVGGQMAVNIRLALDQSSYRSEVERVLAARPQVIFTELDPQSAATFFAELKQLNGSLIPIIGTETTLEAPWLKATSEAVGNASLRQSFVGVQPYAPTTGPAYAAFDASIKTVKGISADNLALYSTDPYAMGYYDSIVTMALAMVQANSTTPSVYNSHIPDVTEPGSGKTVVYTFAQGMRALKAGKSIQFIGSSGPIAFNQWHNSTGAFEIARYVSAGKIQLLGSVSAEQIAALSR